MKAIFRRIAALYLFCASTSAFAGNLPNTSFWVGYNQAWFADYYPGWLTSNPVYNLPFYFGGMPPQPGTTLYVIDKWFKGMADGNAKIVRIWIFPALQGIVPDQYNPPQQTAGLTKDLMIGTPGPSNLETVFIKARTYGLKVYVTALNGNDATYSPLQT